MAKCFTAGMAVENGGFLFFPFFFPNAQRRLLTEITSTLFTFRGLLFAGREMGASHDDPLISGRAEEFLPCRTTALSLGLVRFGVGFYCGQVRRCRLAQREPAHDGSALGSKRAQRSHLTMSPDMKLSSRSPLAA